VNKVFGWTLLFVVIVIFTSGAVAVYTVFFASPEDGVTMPALRDKPVFEAQREAESLGLRVRAELVKSSLAKGRVLSQSPEAGVKVFPRDIVILQVSRGGSLRPVPDVRNFDVARAQTVIRDHEFEVGDVIFIRDDSRSGGLVIAQSPAAPANIPAEQKVDLLVSQGGADASGMMVVPDVAGMSEAQAREMLAAGGFKVPAVDYVYSPNAPEGSVMSTRPAPGTLARAGEGVRMRVATSRRPEGAPAPAVQAETDGSTANSGTRVRVDVPGHEPVFIGDGTARDSRNDRVADASVSVFDQQRSQPSTGGGEAKVIQNPNLQQQSTATPAPTQSSSSSSAQRGGGQSGGQGQAKSTTGKLARIRYQVPPLMRPLRLKIELTDPTGVKSLVDREAKSGEYVSLDAPYSGECVVTIFLGGEFVWQDRYM
jgi:serine/threonine-protein kinase